MIDQIRDGVRRHVWCEHWRANGVLVLLSAVASSIGLRVLAGIYAALLPEDSFAQTLAQTAAMLPQHVFYGSAAIATLGGAVSLLHDLRTNAQTWNILNAVGHMFAAQFAGLLVYLLGIEWGFSWPFALAACGVAGWGGNRTIQLVNDRVINRIFPDVRQ